MGAVINYVAITRDRVSSAMLTFADGGGRQCGLTKNVEVLYGSSLNGDVVVLFDHLKKILSTTNI